MAIDSRSIWARLPQRQPGSSEVFLRRTAIASLAILSMLVTSTPASAGYSTLLVQGTFETRWFEADVGETGPAAQLPCGQRSEGYPTRYLACQTTVVTFPANPNDSTDTFPAEWMPSLEAAIAGLNSSSFGDQAVTRSPDFPAIVPTTGQLFNLRFAGSCPACRPAIGSISVRPVALPCGANDCTLGKIDPHVGGVREGRYAKIAHSNVYLNSRAPHDLTVIGPSLNPPASLATTILHELGHSLGLAHPTKFGGEVMQACAGERHLVYTDDDVDGLERLYGHTSRGRSFATGC